MSKIIATSAIKGAHTIVGKAEAKLKEAIDAKGPNETVEFPNTGYYLPVIYGITGIKIEKLSDMEQIIKMAKDLLPEVPSEHLWLPYLGNTLDAGIATLFAEEIIEALNYVIGPSPVYDIWLGAADDVIMRERGIEFVDGSAPGFAAVVGAAPDNETAVKLARQMQEKSLYVFLAGQSPEGKTMAEQLAEEGVQLGWDTRLVPFSKDIYGHIYSLGFATRAAMAFGGVTPGDYKRILLYNKNRIFAFVMAIDEVDEEKYATAAGAISYGFPAIAHTSIPQILPTGVCTYEHVVSNVSFDEIVQKSIEVRGLKIVITEIPIPVAYGPAFEGERIRKEDTYLEFGGQKTVAFEWLTMKEIKEVEDGKIEVIGKNIDDVEEHSRLPLGVVVSVAGRKMQEDFESILERQLHHFINGAEGVWHMGQRDIIWVRISKAAKEKGFKLEHFGEIIHAKILADYGSIVDKVQVTIYTDEAKVKELEEKARAAYRVRDDRVAGMTDESIDIYYSCTLCQSFAPNHVCVITPQRLGLCGAYNWLDGKAAYEINPTGANQPIVKGETLDSVKGQWKGINEFLYAKSNQNIGKMNAYSILEDPMTSCGCFECIVAILPLANGVMVVDREFADMTPCGMKFSTLAGTVGGGAQVSGFIGVGKQYLVSEKFISAEGGLKRLVWMPKALKEQIRSYLQKRAEAIGEPDFIDKIADETVATTEEEVLAFMEKAGHPALAMEPMI
ncbi:MAG: CO dehydrogenase/CO-methylating acetyl-CoA synthase complex subunit beta [Actinobacteria bacterium]|nr:CO dehydrogenase/CO-methylating acetyl-CoA synthase complex subunit beta [Actinomycetota bacterium]